MSDWQNLKLKAVAKVISGFAFKSSDFKGKTGVPAIKIKNIKNGEVDLTECEYVDQKFLSLNEKYHVNCNDILISLTGSHLTQPNSVVGRIALYRQKNTSLLNQRAGKILPDIKVVDSLYLYFYLSQNSVKESIALKARGAANQANISPGDVEDTDILLPSLPIQRKIASILSAYNDLIENNVQRIKLLEELMQRTYEEWFVKFRLANKPLEVDDETGLPEGWAGLKLVDVAFLIKDSVLPEAVLSNTPYIGLEHIPRKSITLSEWQTAEKISSMKYCFKKGDILFGKIRPYFHKVGIALIDGIASSDTIILRAKRRSHQGIILQTVFSDLFVNTATQSSNGTKMPRANWDALKDYPVVIPAESILSAYDSLCSRIIASIENIVKQNQVLKEGRDILLPRLMSGVIDVETAQEETLVIAGESHSSYKKS